MPQKNQSYDIAVVGGGINGCGIAADAAQRGLSVILIEKMDLASQTSSASSKLIHGGLRYLEQYQFGLVRKSLQERETLMTLAPHLISPLEFILPVNNTIRSNWVLRLGLFLYDHLSQISLNKSRTIYRNKEAIYFEPLKPEFNKGFSYYDATADDSRLVIANALQAHRSGATIHNYTELVQAEALSKGWSCLLKGTDGVNSIKANVIINATGPWVHSVNHLLGLSSPGALKLIKGSHIVLPKLYQGNHAYILQNKDGRIIFSIPYLNDFTLIGTTEVELAAMPEHVEITMEEVNYLLNETNQYFKKSLSKESILFHWSGVRPLLFEADTDTRNLSRDYQVKFNNNINNPIFSVFGGKITTYRQLAKKTVDKLNVIYPSLKPSITSTQPLPGSPSISLNDFIQLKKSCYSALPKQLIHRLACTYGTDLDEVLYNCQNIQDLGQHFGHTLFENEVRYLMKREWAHSEEDILFRRTKMGLFLKNKEQENLKLYCQKR